MDDPAHPAIPCPRLAQPCRHAAGRAGAALPPLVAELVKRGVTRATAAELVQQHPAETIQAKIDVFDWLVEKQDKRVAKSPAGYLVKSIANDYATPKGFASRAERQAREEAKQAKERAGGRATPPQAGGRNPPAGTTQARNRRLLVNR